MGDLLCEWNDLEAASRHIHEGLCLAEPGGDFVFLRDGYTVLARLEQAQGHLADALADIQKAEQIAGWTGMSLGITPVAAWQARLWLAQGNLAATEHWARTCGLSTEDDLDFVREFGHLTLARVLLAQGKASQAAQFLERLRQSAELAGRTGRVVEILVLQSRAMQLLDDTTRALATLKRALALAEPEGYVRLFVDEGGPMDQLLRLASSRGIAPEYVSKLLAAFGTEEQRGKGTKEILPQFPVSSTSLPVGLSERELEVLRLIAAGKAYHAIAQELVIALGTVQSHVKNIYQKLEAHSGLEAVARARELNLIA